jgi:hypothetical protein
LFDIIAVSLSHFLPIDPYELRRILCANRHQWHRRHRGGAVDRRSSRWPDRRDRIECLRRLVGTMFNQTRDIPFAAAMMATLFLIRIAQRLPTPRARDIAAFGLLAGPRSACACLA